MLNITYRVPLQEFPQIKEFQAFKDHLQLSPEILRRGFLQGCRGIFQDPITMDLQDEEEQGGVDMDPGLSMAKLWKYGTPRNPVVDYLFW